MTLRHKQLGITLSGLIMGCVVLGGCALVAMKLFPLYNQKMKVDLAMEKLASTPEAGRMGTRSMAKVLQKQFDVNDVEFVKFSKLHKLLKVTPKKGSNPKTVNLSYEIRGPLFAELDVVLKYDKTVALGGTKTD